ncbi:AAA family ATPase [Brachymonas chironomi]|uniref:AAA family ATPase n=1 Tax=Brachymonas chironomi TaxID=491919 RepID=UPI00035D3272|nr:AAA family ATPase [Brachymonas chironomi]
MQEPTTVYHRTQYAEEMAQQLLAPSALQMNVRSGVFLAGIRRVGKTTFLRQDLVPALERRKAVVIYVDLWSDMSKNPAALVHEAVRTTLQELQTPGSGLLQRLKSLNLGAAGLSFGFALETLGAKGGATLAQAFVELVEQAASDVVLIVDEVQHAMASEDGQVLLHALKAARDAVNARMGGKHHFIFLGTGSHKSMITAMTTRRTQPFSGALIAPYEVLGRDFVDWQLQRVAASDVAVLPDPEVAYAGFQLMGHRPEELLKALVELQAYPEQPNSVFPVISSTLASAAADVELRMLDDLGGLAEAIFARIAEGPEEGVSGLFGSEALEHYRQTAGTSVEAAHVQNLVDKMMAANLVTRAGHGKYAVTDPFVRRVWRERRQLLQPPAQSR